MRVELLYFEDCPNWQLADERLHEALRAVDRPDVPVSHVQVNSSEQAAGRPFHGSPTVLIDGHDPFPQGQVSVGMSCRLYHSAEGVAGAPTTAQLVAALRSVP